MVELWREEVIERSWLVLKHLHEIAELVVIGGWGVYFWARKLRSRDVDVYVDQNNFYKLQEKLREEGFVIRRNPRLKKFEAAIDDVDVDIYTPFMCNLVIPCSDVFQERWISDIEGFKVAFPEVLLLLKAQAAKERWQAEKGLKDRVDIISLLAFVDLKFELIQRLLKRYDPKRLLLNVILRTLKESRVEYKVLGLSYERDGTKLRKHIEERLGTYTV
jgi:hypothetical protein